MQFLRLRAQETNGAFTIFDIGRKRGITAQPVEKASRDEAFIGEEQRAGIAVLVAAFPTTAVNPQYGRRWRADSIRGNEKIHEQRLACPCAVLHV